MSDIEVIGKVAINLIYSTINNLHVHDVLIFLDYTLNTGIFSYTDVTCKSSRYLYYWTESCTQWFLVLFTLNRVVVIAWPLTAKIILSERSTLSLSAICVDSNQF